MSDLIHIYKHLETGGWKPNGNPKTKFRSICPSCGTRFTGNASKVNWGQGTGGNVLVHCFNGCGFLEIIDAAGLKIEASKQKNQGKTRWIDPLWALQGLADAGLKFATLGALLNAGEKLSDAQLDEICEARRNIENALDLVERSGKGGK